jgi:SAM-dependent methyltransferase
MTMQLFGTIDPAQPVPSSLPMTGRETRGVSGNCPICGGTAAWPMRWHRDPRIEVWRAEAGDRSSYAWRLCRRCGNGYPSTQPDLRVLARIWESARAVAANGPGGDEQLWQRRCRDARIHAERSYRAFAPLLGTDTGRFLDIACGLGETVRYFADRGWQAEGLDADPTMLDFHRELAISTRIGQIEEIDLAVAYDLIHIAHAIYFITNPMQFLSRLRSHLTPRGLLCIVLSDLTSSIEHNLPSYSHTFYPTGASMRHALALASYKTAFTRRQRGSIYLAARPSVTAPPTTNTTLIHWLHCTGALRFAVMGRCARIVRPVTRKLLGR